MREREKYRLSREVGRKQEGVINVRTDETAYYIPRGELDGAEAYTLWALDAHGGLVWFGEQGRIGNGWGGMWLELVPVTCCT